MSFKRARSDVQIQKRIEEIINATSFIYNSVGYEKLSFNSISKYTNFTRPTIYKYFKTKDEILLKILTEDILLWVNTLTNSFKLNKIYSIDEVSDIWVESISQNFRLLKLQSILFTTIEKNVRLESLTEFKKNIRKCEDTLFKLLTQLYPSAKSDDIENFIVSQLTFALGLYPMCNLNQLQIDAIKELGGNFPKHDFKKIYKSCIYKLLYCLENKIYEL